jgi:hypothetical protein
MPDIRLLLDRAAPADVPEPDLRRIAQRHRRRRTTRRTAAVLVVSLAVAGTAVGFTTLLQPRTELEPGSAPALELSTVPEVTPPVGAAIDVAGEFTTVPPAPLPGREYPESAWTGTQLLVWGGLEVDDEGWAAEAPAADGLGWDPAAGTWSTLPEDPGGSRLSEQTGAWTGDRLIRVGSTLTSQGVVGPMRATAYDPEADAWSQLPPPPLAPRSGSSVWWSGREVVVWGGIGQDDRELSDGAAFDPLAGSWRALPPVPAEGEIIGLTGIVAGRHLVVLLSQTGAQAALSVYDPGTDRWATGGAAAFQRVAEVASNGMAGASDGSRLLIVTATHVVSLDPVDASVSAVTPVPWRGAAPDAAGGYQAVWAGDRLLLWDRDTPVFLTDDERMVSAYVPAEDRWERERAAPDRYHAALAWTGDRLLVWGGLRPNPDPDGRDPGLRDGLWYRPPP